MVSGNFNCIYVITSRWGESSLGLSQFTGGAGSRFAICKRDLSSEVVNRNGCNRFPLPLKLRWLIQEPQKLGTALFGGARERSRRKGGKVNAVRKMSGTKPEEAPAPSYPELKPGSVWIVIKSHKLQLNPGKKDGGVSRKDAIR